MLLLMRMKNILLVVRPSDTAVSQTPRSIVMTVKIMFK